MTRNLGISGLKNSSYATGTCYFCRINCVVFLYIHVLESLAEFLLFSEGFVYFNRMTYREINIREFKKILEIFLDLILRIGTFERFHAY